jgi:hypothetical protein
MTTFRVRTALTLAAIGLVGALGVAGCGLAARAGSAQDALSPEAQALVAMGFQNAEVAPAVDASGKPNPGGGQRLRPGRVKLRKNVLHGEAVVQTDNGTKTVDVQRGSVTAIDDRSVTVKSTDGFTLTWTFGTPLRVIENRTSVQPSAVKVGTEIGIAGTKDGGTVNAHLIVIPK